MILIKNTLSTPDYLIDTYSLDGFLYNFEDLWTEAQPRLYKGMLEYYRDTGLYEENETTVTRIYRKGTGEVYYVDPRNNLMNILCERKDITPLLMTPPPTPLLISDINLVPYDIDYHNSYDVEPRLKERTLNLDFHYCESFTDYVSTLPTTKLRWKYKDSLKKEDPLIHFHRETQVTQQMTEFHEAQLKKFADDPRFALFNMKAVSLYEGDKIILSLWKYHTLIGICCLVRLEGNSALTSSRPCYYVVIFNSSQPVLYSMMEYLTKEVFEEGTIFHFGPSTSLQPEEYAKVYRYKHNVSNRKTLVPYLAIYPDAKAPLPPYFSLDQKKWILASEIAQVSECQVLDAQA